MITRRLDLDFLDLLLKRLFVKKARVSKFVKLTLEGLQLSQSRVHWKGTTPKMLREEMGRRGTIGRSRTVASMKSRPLGRGKMRSWWP